IRGSSKALPVYTITSLELPKRSCSQKSENSLSCSSLPIFVYSVICVEKISGESGFTYKKQGNIYCRPTVIQIFEFDKYLSILDCQGVPTYLSTALLLQTGNNAIQQILS